MSQPRRGEWSAGCVHSLPQLVNGEAQALPLTARQHAGLVHPPTGTGGKLTPSEHRRQHRSAGTPIYSRFPFDPGIVQTGWADWKLRSPLRPGRDPVAVGFIFTSPPVGDPAMANSDAVQRSPAR